MHRIFNPMHLIIRIFNPLTYQFLLNWDVAADWKSFGETVPDWKFGTAALCVGSL